MPRPSSFTVQEVADKCRGRLLSPQTLDGRKIHCVAALYEAGPDDVSWVSSEKYAKALRASRAGAIIGAESLLAGDPRGIIVADAELAVAQVLELFWIPPAAPEPGVHRTAVVHESAKLGRNSAVGAHAVILARAQIGENSVIHEGVSVGEAVHIGRDSVIFDRCVVYDRCRIGDRVILNAGVVVGADGFGYIFRDGAHRKNAHVGTVIIEDDVEIGANSCIDRAKTGATLIGRGSKIDNLVQVAHNVQIGPCSILVAQCGLSGSVRVGAGAVIAGQSGIADGITIGVGAQVGAQSGVIADVGPDQTVSGYPAREHQEALRDLARIRRLSKLMEQVADLSKRVAELEAAAHHSRHG